MKKKKKIIIIIDSGIGGLYLFKYIKNFNKNYIYIMDNEGFPYGNKNYLYIYKRIYKIILLIKKKYKINLLIIACNTASITCMKILKKKFNFNIIGTFPNIKKAKKKTKNKNILLLGTFITINSNYLNKKIKKNKKFNIIKYYSSSLVKEAEKKIVKNKINKKKIKNIFNKIIKKKIIPDTIILGCTHFSFLKKEIKKIFKKKIFFINYFSNIKKKIKKYILKKNKKTKKYFFYTKKIFLNLNFINIIKNKYNFNYIKKIKI